MANNFQVLSVFKAMDGVTAPMKRMTSSVLGFSNTTQRELRKTTKSYTSLSGIMSKALPFVGVSAAIFAIGTQMSSVMRIGAEFEKTMVSATVKFGAGIKKGSQQFKELEKVVRGLGASTEFTATQAAQGLEFLALAGFKADQAMALLPGTLDLATAAQIDLARASDIASDTLGAFGLMTSDTTKLTANMARVSDVMAKTATSANVGMEDMFETFKEAGPVATGMGQSIETVAALTGQLANSAIKGTRAGTNLKNMMTRLANPVGQSAEILKTLGVNLADNDGNMRDLLDIMGDLERGMKGLGTQQRGAALSILFGKQALAGANVIMNTGVDTIRKYRAELMKAGGASKAMAKEMRGTIANQFKILQSVIESIKLNVFDAIAPTLTKILDKMTLLAQATDQWVTENKEGISKVFSGIAKTLHFLGKSIAFVIDQFVFLDKKTFGLLKVLVLLKAAIIAVNFVMALNPAILITTAIIAGIAGLVFFFRKLAPMFSKIYAFYQKFKPLILLTVTAFAPMIGMVFVLVEGVKLLVKLLGGIPGILSKIKSVGTGLKNIFTSGPGFRRQPVQQVTEGAQKTATPLSSNTNVIKSQTTTTEKSTVDINFNDMPETARVNTMGLFPGVQLNLGGAT